MINNDSIAAVNGSKLNERFGKPLYESYCFAQIPQTVCNLLAPLSAAGEAGAGPAGLPASVLGDLPRHYQTVILILLDAFGWRFFERYAERFPFLQRVVAEGVVSKLTTQFPSTTAAHVTTIHTGLPVGASGVFEWFYYEPLLDRVIAPLTYSFAGDRERGTLRGTGVAPGALYPRETLYQRLRAQGVRSYVFQHRDYTPSPYSDVMFTGARVVPFKTLAEGLVNLVNAAGQATRPTYLFLYYDGIDSVGHFYGPSSRQFDAEALLSFQALESVLHAQATNQLKDTLLLITADHGQMEVMPQTVFYVNQRLPELLPLLKTNLRGEVIAPAGSARDLFLYVREECLGEAHALLAGALAGRAEVYRVADLIAQGLFGSELSPAFFSRVGNLVVLPYEHETVWWFERGRFEQRFFGHHGGLARQEMETLLLALAY